MKLTEKELKEFPVGTVVTDMLGNVFTKVAGGLWRSSSCIDLNWNNRDIEKQEIDCVEIPTYTKWTRPILDDKEREYLATIIRPWRKKVSGIKKVTADESREFITIRADGYMNFPYFKEGTMYKGMKADTEYTLKELGL